MLGEVSKEEVRKLEVEWWAALNSQGKGKGAVVVLERNGGWEHRLGMLQ